MPRTSRGDLRFGPAQRRVLEYIASQAWFAEWVALPPRTTKATLDGLSGMIEVRGRSARLTQYGVDQMARMAAT